MRNESPFVRIQKRHFLFADDLRFDWMTKNELIARRERDLLKGLTSFLSPGARLLEVGCGEGANLTNVGPRDLSGTSIGLDFAVDRAAYWTGRVRPVLLPGQNCFGVCADAARIPFRDESFDVVFCRDVIHHVPPELHGDVAAEMVRVCRSGGVVLFIESNGRNPIIWAHSRLLAEESGERRISPEYLRRLLRESSPGAEPAVRMSEPFPIFRLMLHYRYGLPSLGRHGWVRKAFEAFDRLAARILPRSRWAYSTVSVRRAPRA